MRFKQIGAPAAWGFGEITDLIVCVCGFFLHRVFLLMQTLEDWSQAGWRDGSSKVQILEMNHVLRDL